MKLQLFAQEDTGLEGEFRELITGKFKEQYDAALAAAADENRKAMETLSPALTLLAEKYRTLPSDHGALSNAITREAARERQLREQAPQGAQRIYDLWMEQLAAAREDFPDLDLQAEMRNPVFARLLAGGMDVHSAFAAVHTEELLPAAMAYAARHIQQQLAAGLQNRVQRPMENGLDSRAALPGRASPATMSRKAYRDICRRVAEGEKISF